MTTHDHADTLRTRREKHQTPAPDRLPTVPHTTRRPADLVITSDMIPAPDWVAPTDDDLTHTEVHELAVCESAVDNLNTATWLAGKAMASICNRKLYRRTHNTFSAYVEERWEISERAAYQMIEEWPLAERLHRNLGKPVTASHIRALLPVATRFGNDAAADLYHQLRARAESESRRLTAAMTTQITKAILRAAGKESEAAQFRETAQRFIAAKNLEPKKGTRHARRTPEPDGQAPLGKPDFTQLPPIPPEPLRPFTPELRARLKEIGEPSGRTPDAASDNGQPPSGESPQNFAEDNGEITTSVAGAQPHTVQEQQTPAASPQEHNGDTVLLLQDILARVIAIEEDLTTAEHIKPEDAHHANRLRQEIVQHLHNSASRRMHA